MLNAVERLGEDRRLIFVNVANGVPIPQVMSVFRRSQKEVDDEVRFVARKICEYRFRAKLPPLACSTLTEISWNRLALLETVSKLGSNYLGTSLILPKIYSGDLNDPHVRQEAKARAQGGVRISQ